MEQQNILITGGAGFIGSNLANYLFKTNNVTIIDDLSMGNRDNLTSLENIEFIEGSVTDYPLMTKIFETHQFDYIFHLAAVASVADSLVRPLETHEVNCNSTVCLLELAKQTQKNLKRIVFASSAAIYGNLPELPKKETSAISPQTPYAIDKYSSESYLLNYGTLCGVPASAIRLFNVFGPRQNPSSPYSGVISILIERYKGLLDKQKSVFTCFGDGKQTRDFIFIDDVVQAMLLIAQSKVAIGEFYNIGYGKETSLNDIIAIMDSILEVELQIEYQEAREGDIKYSYCSNDKLIKLGFKPKYTVRSGMKKYISYELGELDE